MKVAIKVKVADIVESRLVITSGYVVNGGGHFPDDISAARVFDLTESSDIRLMNEVLEEERLEIQALASLPMNGLGFACVIGIEAVVIGTGNIMKA
jgi:hypothetical protein